MASILSTLAIAGALIHSFHSAEALQFFNAKTLPSRLLSGSCANALTAEVACADQVFAFGAVSYFPIPALEEACVIGCASSLRQYSTSVSGACTSSDTYEISRGEQGPVSGIPAIFEYHFNRTCLQDNGRWCNFVAYESSRDNAMNSDLLLYNNETASTSIRPKKRQQSSIQCDDCLIKQFQFQAGTPLFGGYELQANYSALTSRCSKTGFPLATSFTSTVLPTVTPSPSACQGTQYVVRPGDTCQSVSKSQSVGTAWLLSQNDLKLQCSDFPNQGSLCIPKRCKTYEVKSADSCLSIAKAHKISRVQLFTWNPILGASCQGLNGSVGHSICVTPPGDDDFVTSTSAPPAVTPTAAPVPADKAQGTTEECAKYHYVQTDEYCNLIIVKYSLTMEDFLVLNQGVNELCTNLYAFESYCVQPLGLITDYPEHPDYVPPPSAVSDVPYTNFPKATFTPPAITGLPILSPLAKGTRKDCWLYLDGSVLNFDKENSFYPSVCDGISSSWGISNEQLWTWNPSLNINASDCAFTAGARYCVQEIDPVSQVAPPRPSETNVQFPIRDGTPTDCESYIDFEAPRTCQRILDLYQLSLADFYKWNPAVGPDCRGMWHGYSYCIEPAKGIAPSQPSSSMNPGSTGSQSSTAAGPQPTKPTPPADTHPGQPENCNKWHVVKEGDGCYDVSAMYGISLTQFYEWNPAIGDDCSTNWWLNQAYCVAVSS